MNEFSVFLSSVAIAIFMMLALSRWMVQRETRRWDTYGEEEREEIKLDVITVLMWVQFSVNFLLGIAIAVIAMAFSLM